MRQSIVIRTFHLNRFAYTGALVAMTLLAPAAGAQAGVGASLTPYGGYLVTGSLYDGPLGTSVGTTNSPMIGVNAGIPITRGISLVSTVGYASGDLKVGLPVIGGIDIGDATTWVYDAGLEMGGLAGRGKGVAPFVTGGIGGMTTNLRNALVSTSATNLAYTAGVGVEIGISDAVALRAHAKDYIGKFDTRDVIGFQLDNGFSHNWALTAGLKLAF